ncbi:lipoprotein signal peptidase [compost metagenome]|uniref:lipoprotein signal peptidase n=1 Tax=Chryseobacterium sp. FH1 TaxID=1233951 RepID=UPI0004E40CD2|nr:lipoprotein signal peptidase [Chryseobacterium sp. FH1]KFC24750.1 peptidase A8 [Chryseobacterium sp. FH1]MBP6577623.1 lipoprotein signal peptidase [Chryseobacterium sp.]MBP7500584.1 lipoprotein signal peptidase [Chryseobacterium sp.]WDF47175.1 lipoprotein signal peptidase [Chryseobacterium sp. KACC 21268]
MKKIIAITFLILLIDQFSKIYVKTHFYLGESINVFGLDWFKLTFVENPGMAYGLHFGGLWGKYALIILRIALAIGMVVLFKKWLREGASNYLIIPMAMIFAGAIGNVFDGIFYGVIFDSGTFYDVASERWIDYGGVSKLTAFGDGYSDLMKGCVVDMLHFPLVDTTWPDWVPIFGGNRIEFFKYIFNVADSSITVGALFLYIFRKKAFPNGLDF